MAVRGLRRQISDSRAFEQPNSPEDRSAQRSNAAIRGMRRFQSLPDEGADTKKRGRDTVGKNGQKMKEDETVHRIHKILFELYEEHSPLDAPRTCRRVDPLRAVLQQGAQTTRAPQRNKMVLRRGQSLPITDENSPVAASPNRKKTKNNGLSPPHTALQPLNTSSCQRYDAANGSSSQQVDMFEFPPRDAPVLSRQAVSEYPRNRPPPVNTSAGHRRMFTPIHALPQHAPPRDLKRTHDKAPPPITPVAAPNGKPIAANDTYSPKPSPIHNGGRPALARADSQPVPALGRQPSGEQNTKPIRPQRVRSHDAISGPTLSPVHIQQQHGDLQQPQSADVVHPLQRMNHHANTIGPGFPLFGSDNQRTPSMFAEMLKSKKKKLRRHTAMDESELLCNEPIPESELQARDAVWDELQALVKEHFLEIENSRIHREHTLGRGKWSAVYRAKLDRQRSSDSPIGPLGHQNVALKEATYDDFRYRNRPPLHTVQEFSREIKVLSALQHPNMPRLHGVVLQPRLGILLELLDKGSLSQNVRGEGDPALQQQWVFDVSTKEKVGIVYDIAAALGVMHEHQMIHRDVKGHNVLLTRDDAHGWHAKLADFGTSVVIEEGETLTDQLGTIGYTAPELYGDSGYSFPADVFSFAIVAWEVFAAVADSPVNDGSASATARIKLHQNPLASVRPDDYAQAVARGVRPELHSDIPLSLQEIISRCWATQPEARPRLEEVVQLLKAALTEFRT